MTLGADCLHVGMTLPPTPDGSQKAVAQVPRSGAQQEPAAQGHLADRLPTRPTSHSVVPCLVGKRHVHVLDDDLDRLTADPRTLTALWCRQTE